MGRGRNNKKRETTTSGLRAAVFYADIIVWHPDELYSPFVPGRAHTLTKTQDTTDTGQSLLGTSDGRENRRPNSSGGYLF